MTYPSPETPPLEAQRGAAVTLVGLGVLAVGFLLQLIGYVLDSNNDWFFAIGPAVILAAVIGGRLIARPVARLLHRRALGYMRRRGE